MEFFKKIHFFEKVSIFRFQLAFNHPQTLSLSQVMQENVILAYYAQIWKFGPRLPKMEFFKKFSLFRKGLQISLLTSPQPPADIMFKSSYASGGVTSPSLKGSMAAPHMQLHLALPSSSAAIKLQLLNPAGSKSA